LKRKFFTIALCGVIVLTVLFIFSQSLLGVSASQKESGSVLKAVSPVLEVFVGRGNVTDHLVRKLAHFTEFFTLGAELSALLWVRGAVGAQRYFNGLFAGVAVALCDETVQLFTGRGSQVQDVWLDIFGAVCGLLFVALLRALVTVFKARRPKRQKTEP